ncbi:MAG TPA: hypothetical protein VF886_04175 [Roseiarcus sp.]
MRRSIALVALVIGLPALAGATPRWTFCVAASKSGADVWITDVFAAERDRVELESAFRAMVERTGARADAQCPQPREDKTEAVNAQFEAEEFNRKLGATLHAVLGGEFPPRR